MTTLSRKLGRRKPHPHSRRVPLRRFLHRLKLTYRNQADYLTGITDWGMLGNDLAGDCTAAAVLHFIMSLVFAATGQKIQFTVEQAFALYTYVTGQEGCPYDPATGACDNGCVMSDVMQAWQGGIIPNHAMSGWTTVNPQDLDGLKYAIDVFGGALVGVNLPQSALDQNEAGEPWSVTRQGRQIVGGHEVYFGKYDATQFVCITWGGEQIVEPEFVMAYGDEINVPVTPDFLNVYGVDPNGLKWDALMTDLQQLGPVT